MGMLIFKYAFTAFVVVLVSEIAKRTEKVGALIASLPVATILIMIWLHVENAGAAKIAGYAYYTFWYVLPTLPMFLVFPWMLHRGAGFWTALAANCALTVALFFVTALVAKRFGVSLIP